MQLNATPVSVAQGSTPQKLKSESSTSCPMIYEALSRMPTKQAIIVAISGGVGVSAVGFFINRVSGKYLHGAFFTVDRCSPQVGKVPKTMDSSWKEAEKAYANAQNINPISKFRG